MGKKPSRIWEKQRGLTCSVPECSRPAHSRGFCHPHYDCRRDQDQQRKEWRRKIRKTQVENGLCSTPYCKNYPASGRKSCIMHQESKQLSPERRTVIQHLSHIFTGRKGYGGMVFCPQWSPSHGGSYDTGEKWVLDNLGPRPRDGKYHLHIVDRRLGFVPDNLQWVPCGQHKREEMINKLLLEVQNLRAELKKVTY